MKPLTLRQEKIIRTVELLGFATVKQITLAVTGRNGRSKGIEYNLPRLVRRGWLTATRYGRKYVYSLPGRRNGKDTDIEHWLISGEALLRFKGCHDGEFYPERIFRALQFGPVPEWAMRYPHGALMLFEYSTADNFRRTKLMRKKVAQYRQHLSRFEKEFASAAIVLFVLAAPRYRVEWFVKRSCKPADEAFYFVDLATFMDVEIGHQLYAPIYFWSGDGMHYPLI